MSIGLRTREHLSHAARYSTATPRTLDEAGIKIDAKPRPIPRRLYRVARQIWNAGVVLVVGLVLWALLVLILSLDELPADVAEQAERHFRAYEQVRGER